MPSGSHGGSPGSHSSGGSSFGGGSWRSSGTSSSNRNVPICYTWHGVRYYVPVGQSNSIRGRGVLILVLLMFAFTALVMIIGNVSIINKIKVDRNYYISMIETAEENSNYKKTGKVKDIFYNSSCNKWYFTYVIPYAGGELEGYTYSIYSQEQIKDFKIGDELDFAVNNPNVDADTDSINFGYKDMSLQDDGEYIGARKTIVISSVCLGVLVVAIVLVVVWMVVSIKKQAQAVVDTDKLDPEEKKKVCKYCGTIFKDDENRCSGCGASRQE